VTDVYQFPKLCKCGCGEPIVWGRHMRTRGVPDYRRSHNPAQVRKPVCGRFVRSGYVYVWVGEKRYKAEHRLVMEQKLGRELGRWEAVHHRDHNRSNNDPDNLELLTYHEHGAEHHQPGHDSRSHVHKHFDCECGQSKGLSPEWRERNRAQRAAQLTRDSQGRFRAA
jgi:hypothetical protein